MSGKEDKQIKKLEKLSVKDDGEGEQQTFSFNFGGQDLSGNSAFKPEFAAGQEGKGEQPSLKLLQDKLSSITENFVRSLPEPVKDRVVELQAMQKEQSKLLEEREKEMRAVLVKYDNLQKPLREKRKEIIVGTEEEEGVPDFWLTALNNHPETSEAIDEHDEPCLKFLQDISVSHLPQKKGFELKFFFKQNPYFSNDVLTKTYELGEHDDMLEGVNGCTINWHKGKNLTIKLVKKRKGKGQNAKTVKKEVPCESFFRFFSTPDPSALQGMDDEEDELDMGDLLEADMELGLTIKQIVEQAVRWYDGSAMHELLGGDDEDDDDDDDDESEDDDDDDDDDDDESEDEDADGNPTQVNKGPNPDDCKQQ